MSVKQLFNYDNKVLTYSNNTVVIDNKFINRDDQYTVNIVNRLDQLLNQCFGGDWSKCAYGDNCDSFSVLLLDNVEGIPITNDPKQTAENLVNVLNNDPMRIKAMLSLYQGIGGSFEIFDVCTDPSTRGKGYAKEIMKPIFEMASDFVWLGVKIVDNPFREQIAKLYINMGFTNPVLTNTTYDKSFEFPFYNISLTWYKNPGARIWGKWEGENLLQYRKRTLEGAIALMRNYEQCAFTIQVQNQTLRYLWDNFIPDREGVLGRGFEYGGTLLLDNNNILSLDEDSIHKGEFEHVHFQMGSFNFHTHHEQCYIKHGCILGWPSATDFAISLFDSESNIMSFVIAIEGFYAYQITKAFKDYFMSLNKEERIMLFTATSQYLATYYEKIGADSLNMQMFDPNDPNEFITLINQASFEELFQFIGGEVMDVNNQQDWVNQFRNKSNFPFPYSNWDSNQQVNWYQEVLDFQLYVVNYAPKDFVFSTTEDLDLTISNILNEGCIITNIRGIRPSEFRRMDID